MKKKLIDVKVLKEDRGYSATAVVNNNFIGTQSEVSPNPCRSTQREICFHRGSSRTDLKVDERMKSTLIISCILAVPAICPAQQTVDFNRDVRPILSDRCFHCHGPNEHDREAELRLASQLLLTEEPNVDIVGTASTVSGLVALLNTYQVGIVILDKDLFSQSTDDVIQKIKKYEPRPKVILLGREDMQPQSVSGLGIDAFVNKTEPPDRLVAAFQRVSA